MRSEDFPGTFIVIEGADGAGTTTQSKKLVEKLEAYYTAEPTGKKPGLKVDEMISSDSHSAEAIALMFAADRKLHVDTEIIPRLEKGETVICDRYYHSSLVYQPALGADYSWVKKLNKYSLKPDLTFILDVSAEIGMERVNQRGENDNLFEKMSFQEEVVKRYRRLPERLDESTELIDSTNSKEEVAGKLQERLQEYDLP